ncbi:MAG: hypothetical protein EH225_00825 [Calditrichaeota bacterium]|nr:winged helix-turn-helix domain-containing protein [Calditrichota bacterium]RQW08038.1 MAG: hypothetical protein EH225_00825 [Calditrichota bacterium]
MDNALSGYQIDDLFIDLRNRRLWRNGREIRLNSKYFDVLVFLVSHNNQLVSRDQLFEQIWPDVIVTDTALNQSIKDIRKAIGDNAKNPRYIKTVPKHGFMFIQEPVGVRNGSEPAPEEKDVHRRPYKFLDYFREEDCDLFFGRETEIKLVTSKIVGADSFIIYGRSGAGKSSFIHAGLTPALKAKGYCVTILRNYPEHLREVFAPSDSESDVSSSLLPAHTEPDSRQTQVFIFDQFEEFFMSIPASDRQNYVVLIQNFIKKHRHIFIPVFVVREDVFAELSVFKAAVPDVFHHEFRLERLDRDRARDAIIKPAWRVNCRIEASLVESILDDLSENDKIDPPQLQIVCDALYDKNPGDPAMTMEAYRELGGASGILQYYLQRVLEHYSAREIPIIKNILLSLVSDSEQRLVLPVEEIERRIQLFPQGAVNFSKLITELAHARIIRFRRRDGGTWVELTHDFLIPEILRWQEPELIEIRRVRSLLNRSVENYHAHRLYIDQEVLDLLLSIGDKLPLSSDDRSLIVKSLLQRENEVPQWLLRQNPEMLAILKESLGDEKSGVRIAALRSLRPLQDEELDRLVCRIAVNDPDMAVRKTASIILGRKIYPETHRWLSEDQTFSGAGLLKKAFTLAFIRDYDRELIKLRLLSLPMILTVMLSLMWIRIRRQKAEVWRKAVAGAAGAGVSGLLMGLTLGIILISFRESTGYEAFTLITVLSSLGVLSGSVAGFGVSLGMAASHAISFRHSPFWGIAGAVAGGFIIGGLAHILGVDILRAIFGQNLNQIAGAYEGAVIGLGLSAGYYLGLSHKNKRLAILLAALGSMMAAVLLTIVQGNLFSASLDAVAHSFSQSQIDLQPLAGMFGESHFGRISRLILGAVEGTLFGGFLATGLLWSEKSIQNSA